ncbi:MAG: hypothetical protein RIC16_09010 [Rhodospirillales bacterium]
MAFLKALVIGMGILIVCAMGLLAYGLIGKAGEDKADTAATAPVMVPDDGLTELGDIVIPNAENCRIDDASTEGRRLTVTLDGTSDCRRVVVIDLVTGAVATQIRLAPARP